MGGRARRFNRIVWGYVQDSRPRGVLAAGLENGELNVFDAAKLLEDAE
jgi:protein transport protein SEC31